MWPKQVWVRYFFSVFFLPKVKAIKAPPPSLQLSKRPYEAIKKIYPSQKFLYNEIL